MTLATNQKAYWKFDEASGNATDSIGSLNESMSVEEVSEVKFPAIWRRILRIK
jgi:hypothetical protein